MSRKITTRERVVHWFGLSGLTAKELEERTGWDYSKVRRIVKGEQDPKGADIEALAEAFGLTEAEFYGQLGSRPARNENTAAVEG